MSDLKSDSQWISGQAHNSIITIGDPLLKQEIDKIDDPDKAKQLLNQMVGILRELNGAGLAAPQIGTSLSAVVIEVRKTDVFPDRPTSPLICMVNPVIVDQTDDVEIDWEGCFSVPGIMGLVPRRQSVHSRICV